MNKTAKVNLPSTSYLHILLETNYFVQEEMTTNAVTCI